MLRNTASKDLSGDTVVYMNIAKGNAVAHCGELDKEFRKGVYL